MIGKFNGNPYVDLSRFVDYAEFKQLEPEILAGISLCKSLYAIESGWAVYNPKKTIQKRAHKIATEAYEEFKNDNVPADSLAHSWAKIKDETLDAKNKMTRYLKSKYGVCDSYWGFQIEENLNYSDVPDDFLSWERKLMPYFSETRKWFRKSLLRKVFTNIRAANILYIENDGIPYEHHDSNAENAFEGEIDAGEFIHFRNPRRGFYIYDPKTKDRIHLNTWAALWDVRNYHSSTRNLYPDWSLRVDGDFTDEVRDYIKNL